MPKRNPFTEEADSFLRENYKAMTLDELAEAMCRNPKAIWQRLKDLGLSKSRGRRPPKPFAEDEKEYITANLGKKTVKEIAEDLGRSKGSVGGFIDRMKDREKRQKAKAAGNFTFRVVRKKPVYIPPDKTVAGFEVGTKVNAKVYFGAGGINISEKTKKGVIAYKNPHYVLVDFGQIRQCYLWHDVKCGKVVKRN